ncbi:hypothetical protein GUJ93_ZPchr0002g24548 [Zizania palustris]|uniref:RING-type E3 ubiquitin transferase n=1 Tax=Zizania palustris TaxID=103762 RepID=A0A8J5RWN3_ZIZPA|nr:hypothetical protein GUJ93_ZPchr0002g24548 [Zizania palustris]KAG8058123.1 hypothetical protein GUJ93_ZPchr0002g24548 [Zizania palustris]KAG8058124.1 hypothetical protein GUJ93_ZPchr0002g24548 [Zizania palustris]
MEEYSGRKSKTAIGFLRRGSGVATRNRSPEERTVQSSVGPGSATRFSPMNTRLSDNQERPRHLRDPFKPSSSMAMPGSSSKVPFRKFGEENRRQSLLAGVDIAESSSRKAGAKHLEGSKRIVMEDKSSDAQQTVPEGLATEQSQSVRPDPGVLDSSRSSDISAHSVDSLVRSSAQSSRTHRQKDKQLNLGQSGACSSSCTNAKPPCSHQGCTSASNFLPSGCSSDSVHSRRFDAMRKRASDGRSSSRSDGLSGPVSLGHSPPTYPATTGPRIRTTTTEQAVSQQTMRSRRRNFQDSAVSVRTRRPSPWDHRFRISEEREDDMFSQHDSAAGNQQSGQVHLSLEEASSENSLRPFSVEPPHAIYSSSRAGTNTCTARRRSSSFFEENPPQTFDDLLRERDGRRRVAIQGIAEVLFALDRIEQEAELSYEQLLMLETNLLLGAFASHDQHSDMRMDIDNMSYEELLALEERIGSVSTALSEEQFVKCLRRSTYRPVHTEANAHVVDDIKCSICQVSYHLSNGCYVAPF